jgi:hypothetical protein
METDDNWTAVAIRKPRMNGLRFIATKRGRSVGSILDMILEKANVNELTDEELKEKEAAH